MIENLKNATTEEIHEFLHGSDPEKHIVALEYGYRTGKIYKIKECPVRGKIIETDTFTPFCWVGNLSKKNFYSNQKHLSFKNTRSIEKKIMWLPSSFLMRTKDQLRIINKIKKFYNSN